MFVDRERARTRVLFDLTTSFLFVVPVVATLSDVRGPRSKPRDFVTSFVSPAPAVFAQTFDVRRARTLQSDEANAPQVPAPAPTPFVFASLLDLGRSLVREGASAFASLTSTPATFAQFAERVAARKVLGSEGLYFPFAPTGTVFVSPFDVRRTLRALGLSSEEFNAPFVPPPPPATPFVFSDVLDVLRKAQRREDGEFNTPQVPEEVFVARNGGRSGFQFPYTGAMPAYPNGPNPEEVAREITHRQAEEDAWFKEYVRQQEPQNDTSFLDRLAISQRFAEIPQDVQMVAGFQKREKWKTVAAGALIGVGVVLVISSLGER